MNRAQVRKAATKPGGLATDRMTEHELFSAASRRLLEIEDKLRSGADVATFVACRQALDCILELEARGSQLQLPFE